MGTVHFFSSAFQFAVVSDCSVIVDRIFVL